MKIIFITLLYCFITLFSKAQSVTLEPGKSVFDNTSVGTEINTSPTNPVKLYSEGHITPIDFYNYSLLHGQIRTSYGGLQIYGKDYVSLFTNFQSGIQRKFYLNSTGNVTIADNASDGFNRFNVVSNDENVAFFGNSSGTNSVINFNHEGSITTSSFGLGLKSNSRIHFDFANNLKMNSVYGTVLRVGNDQKVSINPSISGTGIDGLAPAKAHLDVNNTVRSGELDFDENNNTERRPVFADKDGILRIQNSSYHALSYNFTAVQAQNYDDQLKKGSGYAWFNTTNEPKTMYLPINLPDNVKLVTIRLYVLDNSTSNLSFTFYKNSHISNAFTPFLSFESDSNGSNVVNLNATSDEVIDNINNSYYLNISSLGNWTGNTLAFHSLVITYQYQ